MTSCPSSLTELNKAIESRNPFDRSLVVRSHDVWELSFPDVPSINAHASDGVFQAIEQVRTGQRPVIGITIRAEIGLGKSHLISRVRRRLKDEGGSFLVYMSEVDYGDLNRINSRFLNTLTSSLKQIGNQGVMQWRELATTLVNEAENSSYKPQEMVIQFLQRLAHNPNLVDELTAKVLELKPNIENPYLIQAILWTLSPAKVLFATNWLSGKELAKSQADAMGLPNPSTEDKEAESFQTVCQILDLIGDYRTLIICLDELESLDCNERGFTRVQVAALFAKELYSKIKRGVLMLTMYPRTWTDQVRALPEAQSVTDRIGERIFDLKPLNSEDIVTLVSRWLNDFYEKNSLTAPYPVYPFNEDELRELGQEKPIVRKVLKWCADNWKEGNIQDDDLLHPVEIAFNEQTSAIEGKIEDYLEDNNILADALRLGFLALEGETLEGVRIDRIEEVKVKNADKGYLHFRIVGNEHGRVVKIVVAVIQNSSGKFVSAALKRLIEYKKFDMTRGCLVRSKEVNPRTKGKEHLDQLLSKELGGEFVKLKPEDIKPLLAILFVSKVQKDYQLSDTQINEFIAQKKIAAENHLIREILSDPSGEIPSDLVKEDSVA
jgi:hypothetical protein